MAWNGVGLPVGGVFANPRAQNDGAGQGRPATHRVHHRATGEVPEIPYLGQVAKAPDPVADDRVNCDRHDETEDDERMVLNPFGNGTGDNRRRGASKDELEEKLRVQWHVRPTDRPIHALVLVAHQRAIVERWVEAAHHPCAGIANPGTVTGTKHQIPAQQPEGKGCGREHDEILRKDIDAVFRPREARLNTTKPKVHEENEKGTDEHPDGVGTGPEFLHHLLVGHHVGPVASRCHSSISPSSHDRFHDGIVGS